VIPIGPTPTPPSRWAINIDVPAQLWLWQNDQSELIGEIFDCVYGYQWSANEEKVIVFSLPDPECKNSSATLVDLNASSLVPLFPEYLSTVLECCALSPNSRQLIYIIDFELFTLDSQSFVTSKINAPAYLFSTAIWIDNSRLLVIYFDDKYDPATFGILDLGTGELEHLFSETEEFLGGRYVFTYTVSPDGQWMAFTTSETTNTTNAVWVMKLPDK
jgi:Tol biopolymer transport system component